MKNPMVIFSCLFVSILSIGLCKVAIDEAFADSCTGCPVCCTTFFWSSSPSSVNASMGGSIPTFNQQLNWSFADEPNMGTINYVHVTSPSDNIDQNNIPTYNPSSITIQPDCCAGVVTVQTSGAHLANAGQNGSIKTNAFVFNESPDTVYHTVTVNH